MVFAGMILGLAVGLASHTVLNMRARGVARYTTMFLQYV